LARLRTPLWTRSDGQRGREQRRAGKPPSIPNCAPRPEDTILPRDGAGHRRAKRVASLASPSPQPLPSREGSVESEGMKGERVRVEQSGLRTPSSPWMGEDGGGGEGVGWIHPPLNPLPSREGRQKGDDLLPPPPGRGRTKEGVSGRLSFQDSLEAGQVFLYLLLHHPID
jgi:hypothetical protein